MPIEITWEGQMDLSAYLPIEKPPEKPPIIKVKAYVPSYELQQKEPSELTPEDVKNWEATKQRLINDFMKKFQWDGTYVDNKLNRRLNRVGESKAHLKALIDVVNDKQLSDVETVLDAQPEERRDTILTESLDRSDNVDELVENTPSVTKELDTLIRSIRAKWGYSPVMVNPYTGNPITFDELRKIREGILYGAIWFK